MPSTLSSNDINACFQAGLLSEESTNQLTSDPGVTVLHLALAIQAEKKEFPLLADFHSILTIYPDPILTIMRKNPLVIMDFLRFKEPKLNTLVESLLSSVEMMSWIDKGIMDVDTAFKLTPKHRRIFERNFAIFNEIIQGLPEKKRTKFMKKLVCRKDLTDQLHWSNCFAELYNNLVNPNSKKVEVFKKLLSKKNIKLVLLLPNILIPHSIDEHNASDVFFAIRRKEIPFFKAVNQQIQHHLKRAMYPSELICFANNYSDFDRTNVNPLNIAEIYLSQILDSQILSMKEMVFSRYNNLDYPGRELIDRFVKLLRRDRKLLLIEFDSLFQNRDSLKKQIEKHNSKKPPQDPEYYEQILTQFMTEDHPKPESLHASHDTLSTEPSHSSLNPEDVDWSEVTALVAGLSLTSTRFEALGVVNAVIKALAMPYLKMGMGGLDTLKTIQSDVEHRVIDILMPFFPNIAPITVIGSDSSLSQEDSESDVFFQNYIRYNYEQIMNDLFREHGSKTLNPSPLSNHHFFPCQQPTKQAASEQQYHFHAAQVNTEQHTVSRSRRPNAFPIEPVVLKSKSPSFFNRKQTRQDPINIDDNQSYQDDSRLKFK